MAHTPARILIFGGTFDPPHLAHATLPPLVAAQLDCDQILYVPAAISPLKRDAGPHASAEHRLAMLDLALRDVPHAQISTIEIDRAGPSYTVETLEELRREYAEPCEFRLLIGADQALAFHSWKDWRRILELATPAVMLRPPWDPGRFAQELANVYGASEAAQWRGLVLPAPTMDVTATAVRERLALGQDIEGLLDSAVAAYIRQNGLYRVVQGP